MEENNTFDGEIKVASRIIDFLSSGLYHTPAACLKELVNNAYDARATRVDVFVKPDADRIIVADDGDGMSRDDFVTHFDRVSESHKRDEGEFTVENQMGVIRPKIGKIGIGFIAANELCEVLEIFSTKAGSTELLHVTIDFAKMRIPLSERRRGETDIVKADYAGEVLQVDSDSHYTQLFLTKVRDSCKQIMSGASPQSEKPVSSLYGLKAESICQKLKGNLNSWKQFDEYSETMLNVALNIPVRYHDDWMPTQYEQETKEFEDMTEQLKFSVFYDGTELRKPIVFNPPYGSMLIRRFDFKGQFVSAKGYFYAQHGTVKPNDLHGLLVRIRHAAVGEYDHSFWSFSPTDAPLIQRWVSAEIWADDRLEEAMNIDRRTLRAANPAYVELKDAIHKQLKAVLQDSRKELYETSNKERKVEKTETNRESVRKLTRKVIAPISPAAATSMEVAIERSSTNRSIQKALERKFSIVELYEAVIESAQATLKPEDVEVFLAHLTKKISH